MEVVRALLGAGAVVNQAAVRGHGVVSQSPVVACVYVCVGVYECVYGWCMMMRGSCVSEAAAIFCPPNVSLEWYGVRNAAVWAGDVKGLAVTCVVPVAEQTDGCTPLYIACEFGRIEVVLALLAAGVAVNQAMVRYRWRWRWGYTVLSDGL
jgi:hypothetical protein